MHYVNAVKLAGYRATVRKDGSCRLIPLAGVPGVERTRRSVRDAVMALYCECSGAAVAAASERNNKALAVWSRRASLLLTCGGMD